jgi:hypothetical protein
MPQPKQSSKPLTADGTDAADKIIRETCSAAPEHAVLLRAF